MKSLRSFFPLTALLAVVQALSPYHHSHFHHTVDSVAASWYAGWHATDFPVSSVDWTLYTHVAYSFAETTDSVYNLSLAGSNPDVIPSFVAAAHKNGVKASLSIGGWSGSRYFSSNIGSAANRTAFIKTVTDLVTQYQFDGLDFDWEYPGVQGVGCNILSQNDTANFLAFLKELRKSPIGAKLFLSAAAPLSPWPDSTGNSTNLVPFSSLLDYVAIMNYDVWGSWSPGVGANAPLDDTCAPALYQFGSAVSAVKAWHDAGMPYNKIVLGVASYGHSFNVTNEAALAANGTISPYPIFKAEQPLGDAWSDPASTDVCGVPTSPGGTFNFWGMIADGFLKEDGTAANGIYYRYDNCSQTPYVYNKTSQVMISYDDARSFQAKGDFIKTQGLRGFAMWETGGDHNDILLKAIRSGSGLC